MKGPAALRAAADTCEAIAYGERVDAIIVLLARLSERVALGQACEDEIAALMGLLKGASSE